MPNTYIQGQAAVRHTPGGGVNFLVEVKVPLPRSVCRSISNRAAQIARRIAPRSSWRSWHAAQSIRPTYKVGRVGLYLPPSARYLLYQDQGIRPFVMSSLQGKTVPIRQADGSLTFRKATNVGKSVALRDSKGHWRGSRIAWKHPGLAPKHFFDAAISRAYREWRRGLTPKEEKDLARGLLGAA